MKRCVLHSLVVVFLLVPFKILAVHWYEGDGKRLVEVDGFTPEYRLFRYQLKEAWTFLAVWRVKPPFHAEMSISPETLDLITAVIDYRDSIERSTKKGDVLQVDLHHTAFIDHHAKWLNDNKWRIQKTPDISWSALEANGNELNYRLSEVARRIHRFLNEKKRIAGTLNKDEERLLTAAGKFISDVPSSEDFSGDTKTDTWKPHAITIALQALRETPRGEYIEVAGAYKKIHEQLKKGGSPVTNVITVGNLWFIRQEIGKSLAPIEKLDAELAHEMDLRIVELSRNPAQLNTPHFVERLQELVPYFEKYLKENPDAAGGSDKPHVLALETLRRMSAADRMSTADRMRN